MKQLPIGIMLESLRMGLRPGIIKAAQMGVEGLQIYATSGEMAPENLPPSARKELLAFIKDQGLRVSALCADYGGHGFTVEEENPLRIEKSKRVLDLALDLDTHVVTTHIGVVPVDSNHPRYAVMGRACKELAEYADSVGAYFALETGPETPEVLNTFLLSLEAKGVRVNYDPANLIMVCNCDVVAGVHTLKDWIVHTHAKDGAHYKWCDPERMYAAFSGASLEGEISDYHRELALGEGMVPWKEYLAALDQIGYTGFLTIEREVGPDPVKDIETAIRFLRECMV